MYFDIGEPPSHFAHSIICAAFGVGGGVGGGVGVGVGVGLVHLLYLIASVDWDSLASVDWDSPDRVPMTVTALPSMGIEYRVLFG